MRSKFNLGHGCINLSIQDDKLHRSPLLWVASNEHEPIFKVLLSTDEIDFNREDSAGRSPDGRDTGGQRHLLIIVASGADVLLALRCVDSGPRDDHGRILLLLAARHGHTEIAQWLSHC